MFFHVDVLFRNNIAVCISTILCVASAKGKNFNIKVGNAQSMSFHEVSFETFKSSCWKIVFVVKRVKCEGKC